MEPGAVFAGRYRIVRAIGEGGFGCVYLASQVSMGREVALKTLRAELLEERVHVRRFYREARATSSLDSPHVVRMYDFGIDEASGTPFLVMEYLQGKSLQDLMDEGSVLPPKRAARVAGHVAQALAEALDAGIVHRDLKPGNVFLLKTKGGREIVKVLDFGLAKMLWPDEADAKRLTATGFTPGTPRYMSPEQATADTIDFRSDLYALGCILHEMLTGEPVFEGKDKIDLMLRRVAEDAPPLPDTLANGAAPPPALVVLHDALLARRREDRPASCWVVADICEAVEHGRDVDALAMLGEARSREVSDRALRPTVGADLDEPDTPVRGAAPAAGEGARAPGPPTRDVATVDMGPRYPSATLPRVPGDDDDEATVVAVPRGDWSPDSDEERTIFESNVRMPHPPAARRPTAGTAGRREGPGAGTIVGPPLPRVTGTEQVAPLRAARGFSPAYVWLGVLGIAAVAAAVFLILVLPSFLAEQAPGVQEARAPGATVTAPAAAQRPPAPPPAPARTPAEPAQLVLSSIPSVATVRRGNEVLCVTPCELTLEPSREPIRLLLIREGYKPTWILVDASPGARSRRRVLLRSTSTDGAQPNP